MNEAIRMKGHITFTKLNKDREVVDVREVDNLIVTAGKNLMATLLYGTGTGFNAIALGSGTTSASAGDTALETEITTNGGERGSATTSSTDNVAEFEREFNFTGSLSVTESGILNNTTSGGTLLARQTFSELNFVDGDSLVVRWEITFS